MNTEDHILNIEHQLYKVHKDGYNSNFGCLLKGCVKNPIKSHLISKSQLKKISTNGFVYYPISGVGNGIDIKKRGINNSSIFNLFCIDHDNGLFKFIDEATQLDENLLDRKRKIEKIVKQICIQNMFKVSSMEYFKKKVSMGLFDKQKFRDLNSDQEMNFNMATSVYQYFTEEADFYRIKFEKIMLNQTQEKFVRYKIIEIDNKDFCFNSTFYPEENLDGTVLQEMKGLTNKLSPLYFFTIHSLNRSYICFCWHKNDTKICAKYTFDLLGSSKYNSNDNIQKFLCTKSEDFAMSEAIYNNFNQVEFKSQFYKEYV